MRKQSYLACISGVILVSFSLLITSCGGDHKPGILSVRLQATPSQGTVDTPFVFKAYMEGGSKATGSITFYESNAVLGTTTVTNGIAKYTVNSLPLGKHSIFATYSGDGNYRSATSDAINVSVQSSTAITIAATDANGNTAQLSIPVVID